MWQYFWSYQTDLPADVSVTLFGPTHLAWVSTALLLILLALLAYRRLGEASRQRMQLFLAVLMVSTYLIRWIWVVAIGHYSALEMLPLHLCSLSAWLEFATVLFSRPIMKEFAYACSMPGAIASFITPGMDPYPLFHIYYLQFVIAHSILILLPVLWIWGDGFRPDYRRLPRCLAILLLMAGGAELVNRLIGSNYMFLDYAPDATPLKPLADYFGNPGYQLAMAGLLLLIWLIFYLPWVIGNVRHFSHRHPP